MCPPNSSSFDQFLEQRSPDVIVFDRFIMEEQFAWKVPEHVFCILDTQELNFLRLAQMRYTQEHDKIAPQDLDIPLSEPTLLRELASIH